MANTIKLKKSSVAAKIPLASDLEYGELAINYTDGTLFFKDSGNTVQTISSTQFVSVTGNVTGGNINTAGNVTGNYFIGNGRFLTGLATSGGGLTNGTSAIEIPVQNGNAVVTIGGYANSVVFGVNSLAIGGVFSTPKTINSNVQVASAVNAMVISPLTVGDLGNIFVPDDSTFTIFTPT